MNAWKLVVFGLTVSLLCAGSALGQGTSTQTFFAEWWIQSVDYPGGGVPAQHLLPGDSFTIDSDLMFTPGPALAARWGSSSIQLTEPVPGTLCLQVSLWHPNDPVQAKPHVYLFNTEQNTKNSQQDTKLTLTFGHALVGMTCEIGAHAGVAHGND